MWPYGSVEGEGANEYTIERVRPWTEVRIHPSTVEGYVYLTTKWITLLANDRAAFLKPIQYHFSQNRQTAEEQAENNKKIKV